MEVILLLILSVSGYYNITGHCDKKEVKIVKIGKCNEMGECKVRLSDGTHKIKSLPMKGETIVKYNCNKG